MKKTFMDLQVGDKVWALIYGEFPQEATVVSVGEKQVKIDGGRTVKAGDTTVLFRSKVQMFQHVVENKIADRERAERYLEKAQREVDLAREALAKAMEEK